MSKCNGNGGLGLFIYLFFQVPLWVLHYGFNIILPRWVLYFPTIITSFFVLIVIIALIFLLMDNLKK